MANSKRRCKQCKNYYPQINDGWMKTPKGWFHHEDCAVDFINAERVKQRAKDKEAASKPPKPVALKDKGLDHHWQITKQVMQKYARLRDIYNNYPCISCGKQHLKTYMTQGSQPTGGHYKTGGAHKNLQFNLWNINMEHLFCNSYDPDHLAGMTKEIVKRYGQERLDFLDGKVKMNRDHSDKAYLARMRKIFNKRMKRYS